MQLKYTAASLKEVAEHFRKKVAVQVAAAEQCGPDEAAVKRLHNTAASAYSDAAELLDNLTITSDSKPAIRLGMQVNVNLYKASGKWAYGGIAIVSTAHTMGSDEFKQEIMKNQSFVNPAAFADYTVVVQHRDDYDTDPSTYFCQGLWGPGTFVLE